MTIWVSDKEPDRPPQRPVMSTASGLRLAGWEVPSGMAERPSASIAFALAAWGPIAPIIRRKSLAPNRSAASPEEALLPAGRVIRRTGSASVSEAAKTHTRLMDTIVSYGRQSTQTVEAGQVYGDSVVAGQKPPKGSCDPMVAHDLSSRGLSSMLALRESTTGT